LDSFTSKKNKGIHSLNIESPKKLADQISSINKHLYSYLNILKIFKGFKKD